MLVLLHADVNKAAFGLYRPGFKVFGSEGGVCRVLVYAFGRGRGRAAEGRAGADIELGVMKRAGKYPAGKGAALQPRSGMSAGALYRVKIALVIAENYFMAVQDDGLHSSGRNIFFFSGFYEHKFGI